MTAIDILIGQSKKLVLAEENSGNLEWKKKERAGVGQRTKESGRASDTADQAVSVAHSLMTIRGRSILHTIMSIVACAQSLLVAIGLLSRFRCCQLCLLRLI